MFSRVVAPLLALLAATASARPYCSHSWPNTRSTTVSLEPLTSSELVSAVTETSTQAVPVLPLTTASSSVCLAKTTTTTVVVYYTVTATASSLSTENAAPSAPSIVSSPSQTTPVTLSTKLAQPIPPKSTLTSTIVPAPSPSTEMSTLSAPAMTTMVQAPSPTTASPEPTSSTSDPAPSPPSSDTSKRGIIANPLPGVVTPFTQYPKISWDMNWWWGKPPGQPDNWSFLPQLTGDLTTAKYHGSVQQFPYVVGDLEPDGQMSIDDAVQRWKTYMEPMAAPNTTLIPPMIGQNGLSWLQNFTAACQGCSLDPKSPVAFTIYASTDDAGVADFKHHINTFAEAFPGRELWAANIGVLGKSDDAGVEWLIRQLIPYLDAEPAVTRYAWNGAAGFFDKDTGKLTPLAELYATL